MREEGMRRAQIGSGFSALRSRMSMLMGAALLQLLMQSVVLVGRGCRLVIRGEVSLRRARLCAGKRQIIGNSPETSRYSIETVLAANNSH